MPHTVIDQSRAAMLSVLERALAQSLEPVVITKAEPIDDPGPRIVYVNEAFTRVTGYTSDEVVGKTPRILQGPKTARSELDRIREALKKWQPVKAELLNYRKDGSEFWVELDIFPVANEKGWFTHWVAVQRDISLKRELELGLKAAKEDAEQANRAKTLFVANMSHEIRTPLTAILGYSDMLLDPEISPEQHRESVLAIQRNGDHLLQLVGDILDLSRIEAGKFQIEKHRCSPLRIAQEVVLAQQLVAQDKGVSLTIEADGSVPQACLADSTAIRHILMNLVANALKFTPANGHVQVRVRADAPDLAGGIVTVEYAVVDDGIGIDATQIDRLFEPFEQADSTTSRKYGGTGLGLSICRKITDLLGGTIRATSRQGQGSRFEVRIPCEALHDRAAASPSEHAPARAPTFRGRILVVDDSPDNRKIIAYYLRATGLQIDMATNGQEAIDLARATDYVAIVMDIQMPQIDGYTAAGALRRGGYSKPIIALTAHALSDEKQRCIRAGFTDYLAKPVSMKDLHAMLARYVPRSVEAGS